MTSHKPTAFKTGDRIVAVDDMETTQGLRIAAGTEGTVAEDRGSNLVVFFDDETVASSMDDRDLAAACP